MPLNDEEYEYNNLVIGGATDFSITTVENFDPPDIRVREIEKSLDHGSFAHAQYFAARKPLLGGFIIAASATVLNQKVAQLRAALGIPQAVALPLKIKRTGDAVQKRINCKPQKLSVPTTIDYALGFTEWTAQLIAEDPRVYADTGSLLNLANGVGQVAANAGEISTFAYITATCTTNDNRLKIDNSTTGKTIQLDGAFVVGDVITIDMMNRVIKKNGVTAYNLLNDGVSSWWSIPPGNNTILLNDSFTVAFEWRSAWIGV